MNDLIRNRQHELYALTPQTFTIQSHTGEEVTGIIVKPVSDELQELRDAINVVRTEVYMLAQRLAEVERWQRDIYGEF